MARRFHFISGLPRSGATLLSAILSQNPRFHAGPSSPVATLFDGVVSQVSAGSELAGRVGPERRARLLRGLFESYYDDLDEEVVFDVNRAWTGRMSELLRLFPDAKLIACVRDIAWIMDGIEREYREAAFENTRLFASNAERATVYSRVEALAGADSMVGRPYRALREACWGDDADRLVLVDYDLLAHRPAEVAALIYEFIEEPPFEHDFSNIDLATPAGETALDADGLPVSRLDQEAQPARTILPPDLFERYAAMAFWRDLKDCAAYRIVNQPIEAGDELADEEPDAAPVADAPVATTATEPERANAAPQPEAAAVEA